MKKHIILFISLGFCLLLNTACMDKFLDVSPETGISEDVIFTKYENMKKFFDYIYLDRTDVFNISNKQN